MAFLGQFRVDALVTDIAMPDMDGFELIRWVRAHIPDLPVIAMSGAAASQTHRYLEIADLLGAEHVLQKPFKLSELAAALEALLGHRGTQGC